MTFYYQISARAVRDDEFIPSPGKIRYLRVPMGELASPVHAIAPGEWAEEVRDLADGLAGQKVAEGGDILIFVHGYNNGIEIVRDRQVQLQADLNAEGWRGVVISFDWPSDNSTLNYLEDRWDAAKVAVQLVERGVVLLAKGQDNGCETNIHLLGHSTGAYVIMEAFANAEKMGSLFKSDWRVAQVAFIGGDVSSDSLETGKDWSAPMYKRISRLTNYANPFDAVLAVSNAKRLGTAPRVGRVGLSDNSPSKAANVNCGPYFSSLDPNTQQIKLGTFCHSWHIGNRLFARDLAMTLEGRIDRDSIPTRRLENGKLVLQEGQRPPFSAEWLMGGQ